MSLVDDFLTFALALGPQGRFVLPVGGAMFGLFACALGWALVSQRLAWKTRELASALRTRLHATEVGDAVWIVGRVRAPGGQTVSSFTKSDQHAVVSSLYDDVEGRLECVATRAVEGLVLETAAGPVPIAGLLDVRRTRASAPARNVDERSRRRAVGDRGLRAADLLEGQWVLAHGDVGRVTREGLREQAGVLGLRGGDGAPAVVLTALRPELPRWTLPVALVGATVLALILTPLPWPGGRPLFEPQMPIARRIVRAVRVLGPTRGVSLAIEFPQTNVDRHEREWAAMAAAERGDCASAALVYWTLRRDEVALALIEQPGCGIAAEIHLQLLRETGRAAEAYALALTMPLTSRELAALAEEAGQRQSDTLTFRDGQRFFPLRTPNDVACDAACLDRIRGHDRDALEIVTTHAPARTSLACGSPDVIDVLDQLGHECTTLGPEGALDAVRLAPRSRELVPLTRVEARLQVMRMLLVRGGDLEGARAIEERQRRLLAVLATDGGVRAEDVWMQDDTPIAFDREVEHCIPPLCGEIDPLTWE